MNRLTIFSWGYWGWGNATKQLVEWVDALERARGFLPPVFIDVRIRRSVRAIGFNGSKFGDLLGNDRYSHMPELGNLAILGHPGPDIQIRDPAYGKVLLDRALQEADKRRRVLFFCSCEFPGLLDEPGACHRTTVADLLLQAARKRGVRIEAVEWPGGDPETLDMSLPEDDAWKLLAEGKSVWLGANVPESRIASAPPGSILRVTSASAQFTVGVGPLRYGSGEWYFPKILGPAVEKAGIQDLKNEAVDWRKTNGFESRMS